MSFMFLITISNKANLHVLLEFSSCLQSTYIINYENNIQITYVISKKKGQHVLNDFIC